MAGERRNKDDKLNQERLCGRNLKENNGHDLEGHGKRRKDKNKEAVTMKVITEPGDKRRQQIIRIERILEDLHLE